MLVATALLLLAPPGGAQAAVAGDEDPAQDGAGQNMTFGDAVGEADAGAASGADSGPNVLVALLGAAVLAGSAYVRGSIGRPRA